MIDAGNQRIASLSEIIIARDHLSEDSYQHTMLNRRLRAAVRERYRGREVARAIGILLPEARVVHRGSPWAWSPRRGWRGAVHAASVASALSCVAYLASCAAPAWFVSEILIVSLVLRCVVAE